MASYLRGATTRDPIDVAIIGAGPYGLSLAAHLGERDIPFRIFGIPMESWKNMPRAIYLKSPDFGTSVYSPQPGTGFLDYCRQRGISTSEPCAIEKFTEYGLWAQRHLVPTVEQTDVQVLERDGDGLRLTLGTGEAVRARRVVVAVGLRYFKRLPRELSALPAGLVSHTSDHREYSAFKGRRVLVVGAGQSALEAAALLHEAEANVELLVRGSGAYFAPPPSPTRSLRQRVLNPASVMGPGRLNFFLQRVPLALHFYPRARRVELTRRHLGPWGAWWLRERVEGKLPIHVNTRLEEARATRSGLRLWVMGERGRRSLDADHVVCGTGYEADVDRLPFLDPALRATIDRVEAAPALSRHFESSVAGLFFIGPISAFSFGPLLRFVAGAAFAAPSLARHLDRSARKVPSRANRRVRVPQE